MSYVLASLFGFLGGVWAFVTLKLADAWYEVKHE